MLNETKLNRAAEVFKRRLLNFQSCNHIHQKIPETSILILDHWIFEILWKLSFFDQNTHSSATPCANLNTTKGFVSVD